jgi:transcription antitermination factor NusG
MVLLNRGKQYVFSRNAMGIPLLQSGFHVNLRRSESKSALKQGKPVKVLSGPLMGVEGELIEFLESGRVAIHSFLLGKKYRLEMAIADTAPV